MAFLLSNISSEAITALLFACFIFLHNRQTAADPISHQCGDTGNFTANSAYASNLKNLLSSIVSKGSDKGFSNATFGTVPNQVSGLVLCRGDTNGTNCGDCLSTAARDAQQLCPYNKAVVVWYDPCFLRYSNQEFLSSVENSPTAAFVNALNISDSTRLDASVANLLDAISKYAAYNSSTMFATGEISNVLPQFQVIYGLAQCTPDLSSDQCNRCLQNSINSIRMSFLGRLGAQQIGVRCSFRYEVTQFYQGTPMLQLQLPAATPSNGTSPATSPIPPPTSDNKGKKNITGMVIAIVVPLVLALVVTTASFICFCKRRSAKTLSQKKSSDEITTFESILFDLNTIKAATANFSDVNKLGEGGFGIVYKGVLSDGREIAVKRLSAGSSQGLEELKNELVLVAKLQHRNLVRLLGVCLEGDEKLLIYEHVPNRSLDTILFDAANRERLSWAIRYKIIGGIARGLLYLHEDSQLKIVHRDLKPSNILLDAEMNPKISDFGLARLFGGDQTRAITNRIVGTYGYISPEYAMRGHFSMKSDAYSFGVIVLEIVTGKKNSSFLDSEQAEDLLSYTWINWVNGTISDIIDPLLTENYPISEVLRCIHIALLCIQEDPYDRPNMSTVVLMLNSYSMSLRAPGKPAFCIGRSCDYSNFQSNEIDLSKSTQDRSSTKSNPKSQYEVSYLRAVPSLEKEGLSLQEGKEDTRQKEGKGTNMKPLEKGCNMSFSEEGIKGRISLKFSDMLAKE